MKYELPLDYRQLNTQQRRAVREQYISIQQGLCYYCGELLANDPPERIMGKEIKWYYFPIHFRKHPVHLQHNHKNGLTEGAVHMYCNAVMWQYERR